MLLSFNLFLPPIVVLMINIKAKYRISTPLMIENPVRSPIVPPIADNMSTNLAALSLVILSYVVAPKYILTFLNFNSES